MNTGEIPSELAAKYLQTESKFPVTLGKEHRQGNNGYAIVERNLASESDFVRHDPRKLGRVMVDFLEGWIK